MQIISSLNKTYKHPIALTIGNFDGFHIGHQNIINLLHKRAEQLSLNSSVMSFTPHPKCFFNNCYKYLISKPQDKINYFIDAKINLFFDIPFDLEFANISHYDFIKLLCNNFSLKYLLIGDDFQFGKNGLGDYDFLLEKSKEYDFILENTPTYKWNNKRISSSLVREKIKHGDTKSIKQLLNRNYHFTGSITTGEKLGRKIGFPTANIIIEPRYIIPEGVYAVYIDYDQKRYTGVANIGSKPTFGNKDLNLEVHIFNFNQDIYKKEIKVFFVSKIRSEKKFLNIDSLINQIQDDCIKAKYIFSKSK